MGHFGACAPDLEALGGRRMPKDRLKVAVTRRLPGQIEDRMRELFDVSLPDADAPMDADGLRRAVRDADVLVPTITDQIDADVIAAAGEQLRLIANYGAGVDHIDLAAAQERGILVSNTPGVLAEDTADMTVALILGVMRRLSEGLDVMRAGEWSGWSPTALLGRRVSGCSLGILGMGRIGQAVARRVAAFGMQIHYHNRRRLREEIEAELGATHWESLDQMVANMDAISVNCPHTPSTFHLLNRRRLQLVKHGAVIVNTSRAEVIDQDALIELLESERIAGAGLDVHEGGTGVDPRLRRLGNVLLMPHMASATQESRIEMGEKVLLNIMTLADGHRPPDQVFESAL